MHGCVKCRCTCLTHPLRLWHSGMKQWTYLIFVFAHSRTLKECNSSKNVSDRWKSDVQGVIANPTWAGKYRQGQFSGVTKTFVCRWCVSSCSTVTFRVCVNVWHLKMKSSSWQERSWLARFWTSTTCYPPNSEVGVYDVCHSVISTAGWCITLMSHWGESSSLSITGSDVGYWLKDF